MLFSQFLKSDLNPTRYLKSLKLKRFYTLKQVFPTCGHLDFCFNELKTGFKALKRFSFKLLKLFCRVCEQGFNVCFAFIYYILFNYSPTPSPLSSDISLGYSPGIYYDNCNTLHLLVVITIVN